MEHAAESSGLWFAGNEGMEKKMETTMMGYMGTTKVETIIVGYIIYGLPEGSMPAYLANQRAVIELVKVVSCTFAAEASNIGPYAPTKVFCAPQINPAVVERKTVATISLTICNRKPKP